MTLRLRRALLIAPAALALLAGCATVIDGNGTTSGSPGAPSGSTDFPSASIGPVPSGSVTGQPIPAPSASSPGSSSPSGTPTAASDFVCPDVTFAAASLSFPCLSNSMRYSVGGVTPGRIYTTVEPSTSWVYEIGAGPYDGSAVSPLPITTEFRKSLLDANAYGQSPTVKTDVEDSRMIDGRPGYLLASTITLNPTWAAKEKTKVKVEKLWVVAVMTVPGTVSIWYASVPDLSKNLWPDVPKVIDAIKVV